MQLGNEAGVLGSGNPLLGNLQHASQAEANQGGCVQPKAGEYLAPVDAVSRRPQWSIASFTQDEPVNCLVPDAPDNVFTHVIALLRPHLLMEINTCAAGRDFCDQLGTAHDVIVSIHLGLSTIGRIKKQEAIRLRLVLQVQSHCAIVSDLDVRSAGPVNT